MDNKTIREHPNSKKASRGPDTKIPEYAPVPSDVKRTKSRDEHGLGKNKSRREDSNTVKTQNAYGRGDTEADRAVE